MLKTLFYYHRHTFNRKDYSKRTTGTFFIFKNTFLNPIRLHLTIVETYFSNSEKIKGYANK